MPDTMSAPSVEAGPSMDSSASVSEPVRPAELGGEIDVGQVSGGLPEPDSNFNWDPSKAGSDLSSGGELPPLPKGYDFNEAGLLSKHETQPGSADKDELADLPEDWNWDTKGLRQDEPEQPVAVQEEVKPVEAASLIEPEEDEAGPHLRAIEAATANPPLESLVGKLKTHEVPAHPDALAGIEQIAAAETAVLENHAEFVKAQDRMAKELEGDIDHMIDYSSDEGLEGPEEAQPLAMQSLATDEPASVSQPTTAVDQAVSSSAVSETAASSQIEAEAESEDLPAMMEEIIEKYGLEIDAETIAAVSAELGLQLRTPDNTSGDPTQALEDQPVDGSSPETGEKLKKFQIKTTAGSNLEPGQQLDQHTKELARLFASLIAKEKKPGSDHSDKASFEYSSDSEDIGTLLIAIQDQYVMRVTAKILDKNKDDLNGFKSEMRSALGKDYENMLIDLGDAERSAHPTSWSEARQRFAGHNKPGESTIMIQHEIRDGLKSLKITFPSLKGDYGQDQNTGLPQEPVPSRTAKETSITSSVNGG